MEHAARTLSLQDAVRLTRPCSTAISLDSRDEREVVSFASLLGTPMTPRSSQSDSPP